MNILNFSTNEKFSQITLTHLLTAFHSGIASWRTCKKSGYLEVPVIYNITDLVGRYQHTNKRANMNSQIPTETMLIGDCSCQATRFCLLLHQFHVKFLKDVTIDGV
jgi:hypothetical protein